MRQHRHAACPARCSAFEKDMNTGFQIGQCRVFVDTDKTNEFYQELPRISENCTCGDCNYFENEVTKKDIQLFKILLKMGVDLKRQPNINPDGICSTGETEKYLRSYIGYYNLVGQLGKTQRPTQEKNDLGQLESVDFYESEDDSFIQFKIKHQEENRLIVDFYLECEKKKK